MFKLITESQPMRTMSIETLNVHACDCPLKLKINCLTTFIRWIRTSGNNISWLRIGSSALLCWMLYPIVVITFKVFISWSRRLKKTLRSSGNNELVVFSFWHCLAYALSTSALPRRNDRAFRVTVLSVVFFYCYAVSSYTNVFLLLCWMSCELLSL